MKLLVVSHYFGSHRGGVELVAERLIREFVYHHGIDVTWAASEVTPPPEIASNHFHSVAMAGSNIVEECLRLPFPLFWPGALWRLATEVATADVVMLQDTLYLGNIVALMTAKLRHVPVLAVVHVGAVPYSSWILDLISRVATRLVSCNVLRAADAIVSVSTITKNYFERLAPELTPIPLVFNGVDTDVFKPISEADRARLRREHGLVPERPLLLFVGRFVEKKGLASLKILADRTRYADWFFLGWGPLDPNAWGYPHVHVRTDLQSDALVPYFQMADLLILPSVGEGFPLVVQEAMACGTPVATGSDTACANPGAANLIAGAEVTHDAPEVTAMRFAELIPTLLKSDRGKRRQVAEHARANWSWRTTANTYVGLLEQLVADAQM